MSFAGRDASEIEALHTDRYLEALLAQRDLGSSPGPHPRSAAVAGPIAAASTAAGSAPADSGPDETAAVANEGHVDPAIAFAAARLGRDLVRVHPSFRFEERLARRLADIAAAMRLPAAAGAEGSAVPVIPFPFGAESDPAADAFVAPGPAFPRPVLIGGAVASAAISLAGAALVAWRLGRPGADPMTRAIRAAHQLRDATLPARTRLD